MEKNSAGKFSNFTFWSFFDQKFPIFDQKSGFWPFSPKRYYICSRFLAYQIFFWSLKKWQIFSFISFNIFKVVVEYNTYAWGKFSNFTFWAFFDQNFPFFVQNHVLSQFLSCLDLKWLETSFYLTFYMEYISPPLDTKNTFKTWRSGATHIKPWTPFCCVLLCLTVLALLWHSMLGQVNPCTPGSVRHGYPSVSVNLYHVV